MTAFIEKDRDFLSAVFPKLFSCCSKFHYVISFQNFSIISNVAVAVTMLCHLGNGYVWIWFIKNMYISWEFAEMSEMKLSLQIYQNILKRTEKTETVSAMFQLSNYWLGVFFSVIFSFNHFPQIFQVPFYKYLHSE